MGATEMSCGCIYHNTLGRVRFCRAKTNMSLSGKIISAPPEAVHRHEKAKVVYRYP